MTTPDTPTPETETVDSLRARTTELEQQIRTLSEQARANLLMAELKTEALRAGMIDLDGLKLLDTTALTVNERGEIPGVDAIMDRFRRVKPWLFNVAFSATTAIPPPSQPPRAKLAKEMTQDEYRIARAALTRRV